MPVPIKNLAHHYFKHGEETGATSPQQYTEMANKILEDIKAKKIPAKNNAIKYINPKTNEVVIYNPTLDRILTYYIRKNFLKRGFIC